MAQAHDANDFFGDMIEVETADSIAWTARQVHEATARLALRGYVEDQAVIHAGEAWTLCAINGAGDATLYRLDAGFATGVPVSQISAA